MRLPFEIKRTGQGRTGQIRTGHNRMRNGIKGTGVVFKIPVVPINEWQTEMVDIIPNNHEWYLPFTLGHYHSYFINEIKPFYLIYTIKSC